MKEDVLNQLQLGPTVKTNRFDTIPPRDDPDGYQQSSLLRHHRVKASLGTWEAQIPLMIKECGFCFLIMRHMLHITDRNQGKG